MEEQTDVKKVRVRFFLAVSDPYLLTFDMHDLALGIFGLTRGHQDSVENK